MAEETAVVEAPDTEGAELLKMAEHFDATGELPLEPEPKPETPKPETGEPPPPEPEPEPEPKPAEGELPRDEKGKFVPRGTKEGEPTEPVDVAPQKPETPYTKAQKEQLRKEKTWQQIEQEKREVREERERIKREQADFEAERAKARLAQMPRAQKDGFTAPDYAKAAQDFAKQGDFENAFRAQQTAQELVAYEQQHYAEQAQKDQQLVLDRQFAASLEEGFKKEPDARVDGSPISNEVKTILKEHPYLYFIPDGGQRTIELARMRLDLGEIATLKAENEKLKTEIAEREKKSQPLRSGPTTPGEAPRFEDLNADEMEKFLERAAEEADAMYGR